MPATLTKGIATKKTRFNVAASSIQFLGLITKL